MPKKAKTEDETETVDVGSLQPLLEGMITLLGRLVYPPDKLAQIVTFRKRNPAQYIAIYNLCDGEHTGTDIAKTFNQDRGGLSRILLDWKELGIVYEITKKGGRFYKRLYRLETPEETEVHETSEPVTPPNSQSPESTKPEGVSIHPPSD